MLGSDIIAQCQEDVSDFPSSSTALAIRLLQEADNYVMYHARLYAMTEQDISLVVGQRDYALPSGMIHMTGATYYMAPGSYTPLIATNIDRLQYQNPSFRDQSPGQPFQYYENGPNLGLYLAPAIATGMDGYPKVTLYVTTKNVMSAAATMPPQVLNYDAWVTWMLREYCRKRHPELVASYDASFVVALNDLLNYMQARSVRDKPGLELDIPYPTNR
jgi:hypothetical protein